MKRLLKQLLEVKEAPQSPVGKITRSQVQQSLGFGAMAALFMSPLSESGHAVARAIAPIIMLDAELTSTVLGFFGGTLSALAWKLIRDYE